MPFCKKNDMVQKIVIPKGMIDPNETTIIEIPVSLHQQSIVIARKKGQFGKAGEKQCSQNVNIRKLNGPEEEQRLQQIQNANGRKNLNEALVFSVTSPEYSGTSINIAEPKPVIDDDLKSIKQFDDFDPNIDLEKTENDERIKLQRDLEEFQKARRKLLNTTNTLFNKNKSLKYK